MDPKIWWQGHCSPAVKLPDSEEPHGPYNMALNAELGVQSSMEPDHSMAWQAESAVLDPWTGPSLAQGSVPYPFSGLWGQEAEHHLSRLT